MISYVPWSSYMVWFPIEGDGHPTIDTDLDTHLFRILIVGWMTINHIPCFDRGTYEKVTQDCDFSD